VEIHYACEQFGNAVHELAVNPGRIKERLIRACVDHVHHASSLSANVSPDLNGAIADVQPRATTLPGGEPGSITFAIEAVTEDEASDVANQICEIAMRLDAEAIDLASIRRHPAADQ